MASVCHDEARQTEQAEAEAEAGIYVSCGEEQKTKWKKCEDGSLLAATAVD